MNKPEIEKNIDLTMLIQSCIDYIEYFDDDEFSEDGINDYENDIFEQALLAVFGDDVFEWINEKMQ